jgi:drug/metabolite transporter (DMT)-like permease
MDTVITMYKKLLYPITYYIISTIEVILMKILNKYYHINNFIYIGLVYGICLPYFIYKLYKNYNDPKWYDIITGLLDYISLIFIYMSVNELTFGEYVTYRSCSIFFSFLLIYIIDRKTLSLEKTIGVGLIFIACLLLLIFSGISNIFSSIICLASSLFYAINNYLVDKYVKTNDNKDLNYYWTKTFSSTINILFSIGTQYEYKSLSFIIDTPNIITVIIISIFISLTENYYYLCKNNIISYYENNDGLIIVNFIDILRRFTIIMMGLFIFNEIYHIIIFISFTIMIIGYIITISSFIKIKEYILRLCNYERINELPQ